MQNGRTMDGTATAKCDNGDDGDDAHKAVQDHIQSHAQLYNWFPNQKITQLMVQLAAQRCHRYAFYLFIAAHSNAPHANRRR